MKTDVYAIDFSNPDAEDNFGILAVQFFYDMGYELVVANPTGSGVAGMTYNDSSRLRFNRVYSYEGDDTYILFHVMDSQNPIIEWENNTLTHSSGLNVINGVYWIRQSGTGYDGLKVTINSNSPMVPFYIGTLSAMPEDIKQLIGIGNMPGIRSDINLTRQYSAIIATNTDKLYNFLVSNESVTNTKVINNDNVTSQVTDKVSDLHSFEVNNETTLNNQLGAIQPIVNGQTLINNNKFLQSALWVTRQYNRIVLNTPFESVIVLSLILGLCLVIVGKVRR